MTFILIEILSFFGWYNLLRINNILPLSERLLEAFLLTVWQVTAISILMAWLGHFYWHSLFWWNLFVVGILWVPPVSRAFFGKKPNHSKFDHTFIMSPEIFEKLKRWESETKLSYRLKEFWDSPAATYVALLTVFVVAVVFWYGVRLPMMQYDVYHVVRGVLMIQEGHLPPFGWDGLGVDFYPGNVDVLFAWRLLGTRNDAWCSSVQLVFGIAGVVAIYSILRDLVKSSRPTAAILSMCLFSMTAVIHLAWMSMIDLAATAMVWVAWSFAVRRRLGWWDVVCAALAGGWAVGGKTSMMYWVAGLGVYLIWRIWNEQNNDAG